MTMPTMCEESKGPHTIPLQSFLCGMRITNGVIFGKYNSAVAHAVVSVQQDLGLPPTGKFDSVTSDAFKKALGFDLEAACEGIPGITEFVQPDGSVISWWPGAPRKVALRDEPLVARA